jgi:sulfatase maturation enzyme AslB (radical SAM superfamily)
MANNYRIKIQSTMIVNRVSTDIVNKFYQGLLHFQNIIWLHCTRVHEFSLTSTRNVRASLCRFSRSSQMFNSIMYRIFVSNFI